MLVCGRGRRSATTTWWAVARLFVPALDNLCTRVFFFFFAYHFIRQWLGASSDVTELREAEEKLRQAVENLQLALSSAETGVFRVECDSNGLAELTMTEV